MESGETEMKHKAEDLQVLRDHLPGRVEMMNFRTGSERN